MPQLNAYLTFNGNCADAMRFYERTLNGKLEALIRNGETPDADKMNPADADKIMHAYLVIDGQAMMAGDAPSGMPFNGMEGFCMTLTYPTADEAQRIFDALRDGGKETMPFAETFWADGFGMLVDKFGLPWMVMGGSKNVS